MAMNITEITFNGCRTAKGEPLFQFDYGQIVKFVDLDLPDAYEVHFASISDAETVTVIGSADGVAIPDQYLQTAGTINMYIFLHEGEDDGETEYRASITVLPRPEPSDLEPTPVQHDAITQAIAALNTAVTHVEEVADDLQAEIVTAVTDELATGRYKGDTGAKGDKGDKGDAGDDYILTNADKTEIAQIVVNTIPTATTSANGLMSAEDKTRLDAIYEDYQSAMTALGV